MVRLLELSDGLARQVRKELPECAIVIRINGKLSAIAVDGIHFSAD
ncbi:MAG: hypothetical protein HQM06_15940 [Magnetococcales bacterium]|nr:hypothetical protein [Magnetococcales bacterium]